MSSTTASFTSSAASSSAPKGSVSTPTTAFANRADYDAIFPVPLDAALDPAAADAARFPAQGKPKQAMTDADGAWELMAAGDRAIVNRIYANYGKAIAAYLRRLVSREGPTTSSTPHPALRADLSPLFAGRG